MKRRHLAALLVAALFAGVLLHRQARVMRVWKGANEDVYRQAEVVVEKAIFYKPSEATADDPMHHLSPLIVQSLDGVHGGPEVAPRFGAIKPTGGGRGLITWEPAVYAIQFEADGGASRQQVFLWMYGCPSAVEPTRWFGMKMNLDSRGYPFLWEVFSHRQCRRTFFLSKETEERARSQFGEPLRGRRFTVEPPLFNASLDGQLHSEIVVARVLEDGPVPMGPFVYMRSDCGVAQTILCRCMPSQARDFVETATYDLHVFANVAEFTDFLGEAAWTASEILQWVLTPIESAGLRLPVEESE